MRRRIELGRGMTRGAGGGVHALQGRLWGGGPGRRSGVDRVHLEGLRRCLVGDAAVG